jgi:hypothetical protein
MPVAKKSAAPKKAAAAKKNLVFRFVDDGCRHAEPVEGKYARWVIQAPTSNYGPSLSGGYDCFVEHPHGSSKQYPIKFLTGKKTLAEARAFLNQLYRAGHRYATLKGKPVTRLYR